MSSFQRDWLNLREHVDLLARNQDVVQTVQRWQGRRSNLHILDMGAGTGANFRVLSPRLDGRQHWLMVDNDRELLQHSFTATRAWAEKRNVSCEIRDGQLLVGNNSVQIRELDLVAQLAELPEAEIDLLTASALMDLVSRNWVTELAARRYPAVYLALTYNGAIDWHPSDHFDEPARRLINQHQQSDKGFGPALGPTAPEFITAALQRLHYTVETGISDWRLQASDHALQLELLAGWLAAAQQLEPSTELAEWATRRRELIDKGHSRLRVGHTDLFAYFEED